jgi:hypothetical protein
MNEKCWRNFKFYSQVNLNESFLYSCDVTTFYPKLNIKTTKESKEDFLLVDMG